MRIGRIVAVVAILEFVRGLSVIYFGQADKTVIAYKIPHHYAVAGEH